IELDLIKSSSNRSEGSRTYGLRARGVPPGVTFSVWTKEFGQSFKEAFSGYRMDETGMLASVKESGQPRRLEDITLDPGPYPNGAVWMVAIASDDYKLSAFAKIIPHPISSRDGACTLSL